MRRSRARSRGHTRETPSDGHFRGFGSVSFHRRDEAKMKLARCLVAGIGLIVTESAFAQTDAQVRRQIIRESTDSYPGACPCPYSIMRNGRSCGGRSAYSRPGGSAPTCYPADVTKDQIAVHRRDRR